MVTQNTKSQMCMCKYNTVEREIFQVKNNYHMSCMGVNGEALQLHTVYKKPYFCTASHMRIPYTAFTTE